MVVEVVERYADEMATPAELGKARKSATRRDTHCLHPHWLAVRQASIESTHQVAYGAAQLLSWRADWGSAWEPFAQARRSQASLFRDIAGNPFRPVLPNSGWRSRTALGLAQAIYKDRAFDRLPILADALEDAGCAERAVLDHCRVPGPHVRGCWVVDLILGKQ
jgi:hypothetical protein